MTTLRNVDDVYPLTATQQGMLYHTLSDSTSGVYVNQVITPISGVLDVARFKEAWDDIAAQHDTLRTAFLWDGLDDPLQVVRSDIATEWLHLDMGGESTAEQEVQLAAFLDADRARGFDLANPPLCRMALVQLGRFEWKWVWSFHHLIADGWSVNLILDELFAAYGSTEPGGAQTSGPPRYRDFIASYLSRDEGREEAFWTERLAGFTEPHRLEVPGLPADPDSLGHLTYSLDLGASMSESLGAAARELNVTLNTVFLGAWALILSRWTRSSDVVFGTTVAGRPSTLRGVEEATGLFINTLPQRIEVPFSEQLGSWLRDVQRAQIETRDFEQSSLASIQRWSDIEGGQPIFDSIVVFENYPRAEQASRFGDIEIGDRTYIEQSNYPLAVLVIPGDSIRVSFVYDTSAFSAPAIENLGSQIRAVLASIISNPHDRLAQHRLTGEEDEAWLRRVGVGPDAGDDASTIHEIIRHMGTATPDATAVVDSEGSTSYRDLLAQSEAIADRLAVAGVGPNRLVGLYLPRSVGMVAGMLGILQAGGAYVPLDPAYPTAHLRDLLSNDEIEFVLTSSSLAESIPPDVTTVIIDPDHASDLPSTRRVATESDLAYVIHTSGSTGRPKGVMVTHRNLVQSTRARAVHYGEGVERFLLLSSFAFDSSVAGIFWTLTTGGTLVLPVPDLELDVVALLDLAREERVTHTLCLPSLYEVLLENAGGGQLDSLRVAIVAGEACPSRLVGAHRSRLSNADLHNEYGPTEATVWCTAHRASGADDVLPIGRPIAGTRIYLLDEHGNPVPPGFPGEICVAGSGVAAGYHDRPDLTAERFVSTSVLGRDERIYRTGDLGAWRTDEVLAYLGRTDTQLKIRGHRIEPAAVETALLAQPSVREAVAVGRSAPGRPDSQLVAYVGTDQQDLVAEEVKRAMSPSLPEFMVPDIVVPLKKLPRLPNGKVDVGSLPDPRDHSQRVDGHIAPRTDRERVLAAIWSDLLGLDEVGVRDDFFQLGGDSIVSIRMISRARQAGVNIVPGQITSHPTIEQLALSTDSEPTAGHESVSGPVPLGPIQQWFFEMDHASPGHWNQSNLFAVDAGVDADALEQALQACLGHHDMLRARFRIRDATWTQSIDPDAQMILERVKNPSDVDRIIADCQRDLDLESGPLFRAVLIERPTSESALLFLAVHHLVVDAVSWTILVDDLERAYLQASTGEDIVLPPRSTSYRDWISYLGSGAVTGELDYWAAHEKELAEDVPRMWGTEATRQTVTVELDPDVTGLLLRDANDAFRTHPDELMIAALAPLLDPQSNGAVRIALERHGRSPDVPRIDLSRTVGWFTAQYPVTLTATATDDADLITATKETLRRVPNGGVGYGALRYLDQLPELVRQPEPAYLFNYLSSASADSGGFFRWVSSADDSGRHPDNERAHRIEIVAALRESRLVVMWHFSTLYDDLETVQALANDHLDRLSGLVSYCMADGSGGLTPSDFPAAALDQSELDRFLGGIA